jgi:hypothetical protein
LSKSDPALYVYMLNGAHETLLGITETVTNDLSPQWAYSLVVDYFFERQQMLRFYVVDIDSASKDRSAHDQLGTCDVPLAQIVSGKNGRLTIPLKGKGAGKGTLTVTSEELSGANELLTFSVLAKNIDKKDFLGKSDGFLIFKRAAEDGSWIAVHKTEVVKNSLNPVWKPITISLTQLANGDWDRPLRIELYDWDANSDADYIGQFDTSASALRAAAGGAGFPLINAELAKKKGKKYDNSGVFHVTAFKSEKQHTFVDYLRSGTRINCIVSIDFTASNGVPNFAQSLHYQNPYEPNPYQKAINSVGTVLIDYDSDKQFVAYGFGARVPPNNKTSHCFPLTYDPMQPEVPGIAGLLAAYANVLMSSELYGPTNFAPTIHQTISISKARPGEYRAAHSHRRHHQRPAGHDRRHRRRRRTSDFNHHRRRRLSRLWPDERARRRRRPPARLARQVCLARHCPVRAFSSIRAPAAARARRRGVARGSGPVLALHEGKRHRAGARCVTFSIVA